MSLKLPNELNGWYASALNCRILPANTCFEEATRPKERAARNKDEVFILFLREQSFVFVQSGKKEGNIYLIYLLIVRSP